jgi:hypothetical protein
MSPCQLANAAVEKTATADGPKITYNVIKARMGDLMYRIASMKFEVGRCRLTDQDPC